MSKQITEIEDISSDDDFDDYDRDAEVKLKLKKNISSRELAEKLLRGEEDVDVTELFTAVRVADSVSDPDGVEPAELAPLPLLPGGDIRSIEDLESFMEPVIPDGGVLKRTVRHGEGPLVPSGAVVMIHYKAFLEYGDQPFDSTYMRRRPQSFRLQMDNNFEVIPGLDVAVSSMKKNENAYFVIKPAYAYGERGCVPRIPGNAALLYDVTLLNWIDENSVEAFQYLSVEQMKQKSLKEILDAALEQKKHGNALIEAKNYKTALKKYNPALHWLNKYVAKDEEEEIAKHNAMIDLYLNKALCLLKLNSPKKARMACDDAIGLSPNGSKVHKLLYRKGMALEKMGETQQAFACYQRAQRLQPSSAEIRQAIQSLQAKLEEEKRLERNLSQIMLFGSKTAQN